MYIYFNITERKYTPFNVVTVGVQLPFFFVLKSCLRQLKPPPSQAQGNASCSEKAHIITTMAHLDNLIRTLDLRLRSHPWLGRVVASPLSCPASKQFYSLLPHETGIEKKNRWYRFCDCSHTGFD
jgi:hypothetical protein